MNVYKIGNLAKSKVFVSIDNHPIKHSFKIHFGKTYRGTIAGMIIFLGKYSVLAHIRK